jgi:drug/metabolite transporter (DMT)-like permease
MSTLSDSVTHLVSTRHSLRLAVNALLAGALGIAFAPIFVRLSQVGPGATAFWRLALAFPALWLWMSLESRGQGQPRRPSTLSDFRRLAAAGFFFAGDLGVWHWSIKFTSVANATLLANFAPVFVALGGWLFFQQRVSGKFVLGMCVALGGMILLVGENISLSSQHMLGDALGLITAIFYAGYILWVKRLRQEFSTPTIMVWSGLVSIVILFPVTLVSGEVFWPFSWAGWLVLAALALVSQFGGQTLITFALARLPAAYSSVTLLVQPVMAAIFAWVFLGEPLGVLQAAGGCVALLGIYLARQASEVA